MTNSQTTSTNCTRLPGLDLLRCLAAALVFVQHSLSSCHYDDAIDFAGFRIGRIGTAIFFLLGGFLCAKSSRRPLRWLQDRLLALLPAYWIIVAVGFGIALVVRSKEFDLWQVVCQFAGIGYFTHGDRLINVATWFITPLLLFYGIATILRSLNSQTANILTVALFVILAIQNPGGYDTALCHGATFFAAFAISMSRDHSGRRFIAAVAGFSLLCMVQSEFRYATLASILLLPAIQISRPSRFASSFTSLAYEWFLVHGIVLTGVSRAFSNPLAVMIVSVPVSLLAAWFLKRTATGIVAGFFRESASSGVVTNRTQKCDSAKALKSPLSATISTIAGPHGSSSKRRSRATANV